MNAFILAGGLSTRMGRDKALLEWQGRPLIQHAVEKLRALDPDLRTTGPQIPGPQITGPRILGARPDLERFAPVLPDSYSGRGPLGGIEAALSATDTDLNLFLPVDLPLLPGEFLHWMAARAEITQAGATVPHIGGRPQPLCAVYHRGLLAAVRSALQQGDGKVMRVIGNATRDAGLRTDHFDVEAVAAAGTGPLWSRTVPTHRWFENLNNPQDLVRTALEQTPNIH